MKAIIVVISVALLVLSCKENKSEVNTEQKSVDQNLYSDYAYQYSIIDALLAGVYDGNLTFGELKKHGDFGLGGFNHLDGELLMNDNQVFKMRFDGSILKIPDEDSTGIAFVKFFKSDNTFTIQQKGLTYQQLQDSILKRIEPNSIYAVRIKGRLKSIKARAPKPSEKPYLPLAEYLKSGGQSDFNFENMSGTFVGFYMPDYATKLNIPGFHTHFITDDQKNGGHIFDFETDDILTVELDKARGIIVEENTHLDWQKLNLKKNLEGDLKNVE